MNEEKRKDSVGRKSGFFYLAVGVPVIVGLIVGCLCLIPRDGEKKEPDQPAVTTKSSATTLRPTETTAPTAPSTVPTPPEEVEPEPEPEILPEYLQLYAQNNDMVGWIKIPGTAIDNPVVQTPDRPNYYLHRDFSGAEDYAGTLYVREKCNVNTPSDNVTIYGHNMANGTMFGPLHKYKEKSFWEANTLVQFDTLYERHTYEIFAVFRVSANGGFSYHTFDTAVDEAAYDAFVSQCKALSFYDTGVTPQYGEKLVTLSTCDRAIENGRLVVVARRIT